MMEPSRFVFLAMGSECVLDLYATDTRAAEAAEAEVSRIEHRLSRHLPDSILSKINRVAAQGGEIEVDDEMASLIDYAYACHRKSEGLFDITTGILRRAWNFSTGQAPTAAEIEHWLPYVGLQKILWERPKLAFPIPGIELDFGGIGKEYAADRVAAVCAGFGVVHGLVNLGGDLRVIGPRPDGSPWPISICDPQMPGKAHSVVHVASGGLTTSGDYERCVTIDGLRYGHILNPFTGWPVRGLAGVTVAADTCLVAGSVSTIAMLKGVAGIPWLSGLGLPYLWIDSEGNTGSKMNGSLEFLDPGVDGAVGWCLHSIEADPAIPAQS